MSDFEDDDDMLLELLRTTQHAAPGGPAAPVALDLFRAQGEISILRAQLESLRALKSDEVAKLSEELHSARATATDRIAALKQSVDKLEDEKKFLGNEIRSLSAVKKRKLDPEDASTGPETRQLSEARQLLDTRGAETRGLDTRGVEPRQEARTRGVAPIHLHDDWSQLCDFLWRYTINGSTRSTMEFLSRICVEEAFQAGEVKVQAKMPILACVWEYLMAKKDLRLDDLVETFCNDMLAVVKHLLALVDSKRRGAMLAVPFLMSLINASITFKGSAVTKRLVETLVAEVCAILTRFVFALQLDEQQDDEFLMHHDVTYQHRLLENFTLILGFDLLENAVTLSTQFDDAFVAHVWSLVVDFELLKRILPENSERFISAAQINLVFNFVEMLSASLTATGFATSDRLLDQLIVKSLIKVFLIDITIKEDFCFYGLNRVLGNNHDFDKISQAIPDNTSKLISLALPVETRQQSEKALFHLKSAHDCHLLSLKVRIVTLLEALLMNGNMDLVNLKENIKSIVRIIGFEQNQLIHQPRSKYIFMNLTIVGGFIKILYYIIEEHKNINTLIYPETLHEVFVVLMRIAFGSDSLSTQAHALLSSIRSKGVTDIGIYNKWCEMRSREITHFNLFDSRPNKFVELGNIEGDFANGLEFPYDEETIEIAREILSVCVNHDEADNLYYNMTSESQV